MVGPENPAGRRRYRPPAGFPYADDGRGRWRGVAFAIAVHAVFLFLLLTPPAVAPVPPADDRSLGVAGDRRGGGGGGSPGTSVEHLQYVQAVAAPPPVVLPPRRPVVRPPVVPKRLPPPTPVITPAPAPVVPAPTLPPALAASGTGAASGAGAGPGTGGGVGTGQGTGVGSGVGPGARGSPAASKIKAYPIELPAAGLDAPRNIHPSHLDIVFEVTEHGDAKLLSFTQTNDGGFNRRLRDELSETRFHAAALPDGTPVRDTVDVTIDLQ
jgi:periplasmic protein TonB